MAPFAKLAEAHEFPADFADFSLVVLKIGAATSYGVSSNNP